MPTTTDVTEKKFIQHPGKCFKNVSGLQR